MAIITDDQLRSLMEHRRPQSITIHAPMHRAGRETAQNAVRFKNGLREARETLEAMGVPEDEARRRLRDAAALVEDTLFWRHQGQGLAVYLDAQRMQVLRLPLELEPRVVVGDRFFVKPLLRLLSGDGRFYILALSQKESRFFEASRFGVRPMELVDAPESIDDLMQFIDEQKSLQFHTSGSAPPGGGRRSIVFHGHGVGIDDSEKQKRLFEYCRMVDRSICRALGESDRPLVLAADETLQKAYRKANRYDGLLDSGLRGNPERLEAPTLHEQAWPRVRGIFEAPIRQARERFQEAAAGPRAVHEADQALESSLDGQIDTLFVAYDAHVWGRFDPASRMIERHESPAPDDEELLDRAAVQTYLHGGTVYAVSREAMPESAGTSIAAILRYPRVEA